MAHVESRSFPGRGSIRNVSPSWPITLTQRRLTESVIYRSRETNSTVWKSTAFSESNPTTTAVCNMSFDKDMYSLTAILLAEAAMVLLRPDRINWAQTIGGGVLTPATLGHQYVERVKAAGIQLEVVLDG